MRTINSPLYQKVLETHHLTIGNFYFLENFLIAEINEGIHLDSTNTRTLLKIVNSFFKNRNFGHIINRINKYSVSPLDYASYCKKLDNVVSFSSIIYDNHFDKMNVKIENHFLHKPFHIAKNIEESFLWSEKAIKKTLAISA
ncbi:hypothetical protein [uncultured Lacinutrix sp.]|uniref:hypothetical protein n=1 Tax=uncultured Lacinutrix sp. TaxID=574032 RepID=UPI002637E10C|nr:hypothetical protein [uncultured Lacinutrix sp.]